MYTNNTIHSPDPVPPAMLWNITTPMKQSHCSATLLTASLTLSTIPPPAAFFGPFCLPLLYPQAQLLPLPVRSVIIASEIRVCGELLRPKQETAGLGSLSTTTHGRIPLCKENGMDGTLLLFKCLCTALSKSWSHSSAVSQNDLPSWIPHCPTCRKQPLAISHTFTKATPSILDSNFWASRSPTKSNYYVTVKDSPKV